MKPARDGGIGSLGESKGRAIDTSGEGIEEVVVGVDKTELGKACVVGQTGEEIEFRILERAGDVGVDGTRVESTEGAGEFVAKGQAQSGTGPHVVAREPQTAEVVFAVVAGFEGQADGIKETDGFRSGRSGGGRGGSRAAASLCGDGKNERSGSAGNHAESVSDHGWFGWLRG